VSDFSALELTLRPLRPLLADREVTELCINRPREAFLETGRGWHRATLEFADFDWCLRLAKLVANYTCQRIDEQSPLLTAALPSGERIQVVIPPATTTRTVALTIRRPSRVAESSAPRGARAALSRIRRPSCCDSSTRAITSASCGLRC